MRRRALVLLPLALLTAACTQVGSTGSPAGSVAGVSAEPSTAAASPATSPAASPAAPSASGPAAGSPGTGQIEIVGVEYAFEGVPATAASGTTLSFRNGGAEVHEMVVVRKNDGVTESWDELLQLPDAEAFTKIAMVGAAMAPPGTAASQTVAVEQPGDYLMICFVPVGTTSTASIDPSSPPTGEPHFLRGMRAEFTVGS